MLDELGDMFGHRLDVLHVQPHEAPAASRKQFDLACDHES